MKQVISFLLFLFTIALNVYLIHETYKIKDDCDCATDTLRIYLYIYLIASTIWSLVMSFVFLSKRHKLFDTLQKHSLPILILCAVIYGIISYKYINKLKERGCKCTKTIDQQIFGVISYVYATIVSFAGVIILFGLIGTGLYIEKRLKH